MLSGWSAACCNLRSIGMDLNHQAPFEIAACSPRGFRLCFKPPTPSSVRKIVGERDPVLPARKSGDCPRAFCSGQAHSDRGTTTRSSGSSGQRAIPSALFSVAVAAFLDRGRLGAQRVDFECALGLPSSGWLKAIDKHVLPMGFTECRSRNEWRTEPAGYLQPAAEPQLCDR
jgi:hypothetical protein